MAISYDTTSTGINVFANPLSSPQTFSHTVGTTSGDRILVVAIAARGGSGITGVTYAGVAMSLIRADAALTAKTALYQLVNPATGANTVSISHTNEQNMTAVGVSLYGVDQTNPVDANDGTNGQSAGPVTITLATTEDNTWIIDSAATRTSASQTLTMTAATNRVERSNLLTGANGVRGAVSTVGAATSAGDYVMEWTKTVDNAWAISAASFSPAGAASSVVKDVIMPGLIPFAR